MKLNSQKEIAARGIKLISKRILKGLTRDEYTDVWEDNCMLGFIYQLQISSTPLTYKEIGLNIGWQWRTVKSQHEALRNKDNLIGQTLDIRGVDVKRNNCRKAWYMNNQLFKNAPFNKIIPLIKSSYYSKMNSLEPNIPERKMFNFLNKVHPVEWDYTGARLMKNRIGKKYYPDFTNKKRKILAEHIGPWCHPDDEEKRKTKFYRSLGWRTFCIWDYNEEKENEYIQKLKDIDNYAI